MTVYEVALHFQSGADDFYNVVHYDITGDEPLDLQDLTDEIFIEWIATLGTITAPAMSFIDITYRLDIDGSVGSTVSPTAGAAPGTATNNNWMGQSALLVQKRTGGLVRPTLGRAFCVGISTSNFTAAGEWSSGVTAIAESFWDNIILVPFAGNGNAEMLLKAGNPAAPNTNAYNSVTECVALANPSALQSRKKGRGA